MNTKPNAQTKLIEKHLKKGKSITPIEALNLFGCFRLAKTELYFLYVNNAIR